MPTQLSLFPEEEIDIEALLEKIKDEDLKEAIRSIYKAWRKKNATETRQFKKIRYEEVSSQV